ncbi:hypothetical protein [Rhizobium leguminosarum]|uniref:hypothetical protein n=1 Tax=Rhizobium leguminosarum TaxID=384 RepID=UPI001031F59D|nr:hypothetical protein [Rhizobium leguminosarum]TAV89328.1 hypothetical protein ELI22_08935 [Rhizobium leguminosarum]TAV93909.1 hypothetical protein ELI21_08925 [Rhizobium leguminosarum]TAW34986.1 hypothetical protein ELI23_08965 [Rhizobium leguminosarum]
MIFRLILAAALFFPVAGALLLELGMWGQGINQYGYPNGATLAMLAFTAMFLGTASILEKVGVFASLGATSFKFPVDSDRTSIRCAVALLPMATYVLFGLGGFHTIVNGTGAGEFRTGLGSGGSIGYLILKFYAPALFSAAVLSMAAAGRVSAYGLIGLICLALISVSFGYKSAIVMALLPTIVLLFWRAQMRTAIFLLAAALSILVVTYWFLKPDDQAKIPLLGAIAYRAFVLNAEGAWKIWDVYSSGGDLPSYVNTLPAILGDRILAALTGITRSDPDAWVMSHFSLMATHLAGYTPTYLLATGHNNSAGAMAEGIVAGGVPGMLLFAVIAGALANALYHFIDNRLKAQDFAAASVAACYFIYCLISWLIGGGVVEIIHLSVLVGLASSFVLLRWATGWKPVPRLQEAT